MNLLGRRESQQFEAKRAEALDDPETLPRAVSAMLNAGGGEVWVGLDAHDGVVTAILGVADPESARRRVSDRLVDMIEPPPTDEVEVEVKSFGGKELLRVIAKRTRGRGPYLVKRRNGLKGYVRTQDRNRSLTWDEIRQSVLHSHGQASDEAESVDAAVRKLIARREKVRTPGFLHLRLVPVPPFALELSRDDVNELYRNAAATGNRESGWNFITPYATPKKTQHGWSGGDGDAVVNVMDDGAIELRLPFERLHWQGPPEELWPWALVEHAVAVFRLARVLYTDADHDNVVLTDLALFGLRGWRLGPYSPRAVGYRLRDHTEFVESDFEDDPLHLRIAEIVDSPDRCAWRLLRRLWAAFGYTDDQMPKELDPDRGLILPE